MALSDQTFNVESSGPQDLAHGRHDLGATACVFSRACGVLLPLGSKYKARSCCRFKSDMSAEVAGDFVLLWGGAFELYKKAKNLSCRRCTPGTTAQGGRVASHAYVTSFVVEEAINVIRAAQQQVGVRSITWSLSWPTCYNSTRNTAELHSCRPSRYNCGRRQ